MVVLPTSFAHHDTFSVCSNKDAVSNTHITAVHWSSDGTDRLFSELSTAELAPMHGMAPDHYK